MPPLSARRCDDPKFGARPAGPPARGPLRACPPVPPPDWRLPSVRSLRLGQGRKGATGSVAMLTRRMATCSKAPRTYQETNGRRLWAMTTSAEDPIVVVGTARTAIGGFQGALAPLTAPQLGSAAIKAAVSRAGLQPQDVSEVLMGCVLPAGQGQAPARQADRKSVV